MPRGIYSITSWTPNLEDEPRRIFKKPPQHGFRRRIWRKGKYPFGGHWRSPSPFLWYIPHFFNTSTPIQPQFLLCFAFFFYLFCILTCGVYDSSLPQVEAPLRYISGGSLLPGIKFVINIERLTPSFYPALTHFLISPSPLWCFLYLLLMPNPDVKIFVFVGWRIKLNP